MAFINIKDWVGENIDIYKIEDASEIEVGAKRLVWLANKYATQKGTKLTTQLWNELQKGIAQYVGVATYQNQGNEIYIVELQGLNNENTNQLNLIPLFDGLEIKMKIPHNNETTTPSILLNSYLLPIKKINENGVTVDLTESDLSKNQTYNFIYENNLRAFVCRELSFFNIKAFNVLKEMITRSLKENEIKFNTLNENTKIKIQDMEEEIANILRSAYNEREHYKKDQVDNFINEINSRISNIENVKANIQGENIHKSEFRNNLNVYSKEEIETKLRENVISPINERSELFLNGIVSKDTIKKIIQQQVVNATDNIKGLITKNEVKTLSFETIPNINVMEITDILKGVTE